MWIFFQLDHLWSIGNLIQDVVFHSLISSEKTQSLTLYKLISWKEIHVPFLNEIYTSFVSCPNVSKFAVDIQICFIPCRSKLHENLHRKQPKENKVRSLHAYRGALFNRYNGQSFLIRLCIKLLSTWLVRHKPYVDCSFHLIPCQNPYLETSLCKIIYALGHLKRRKVYGTKLLQISKAILQIAAIINNLYTPFCNLSSTAVAPTRINSLSILSATRSSIPSLSAPIEVFAFWNSLLHTEYSDSSSFL